MTDKHKGIFKDEYKVDDYTVVFNINGEETIYTEKCYENLYKLDIIISNNNEKYEYNNYYIKIDHEILLSIDIVKEIISNLYQITFFNHRFIGEVINERNKTIITSNRFVEEQLNKKNAISDIYSKYLEYNKDDDYKLKYEAFFEVYFSTHSIPDSIRKEYVKDSSNLFDISSIDLEIKKGFKGKAQQFAFRTEELEKEYEQLKSKVEDNTNIDNRIKICKHILDKINEIEKKNNAYNKIIEERNNISKDKALTIILKLNKKNALNKKIKFIESRFNYNKEIDKLKTYIKEKTKDDLISDYDISIDDIRKEIKKCVKKLNLKLSKINKHNEEEMNLKKHIDLMFFDDIYFEMEDIEESIGV